MSQKSLVRHYLELTRIHKFPLGNDLIIWPSVWGLLLAANNNHVDAKSLVVQHAWFAIGSTLVHCAACVINDICDRNLDGKVERTKNRPLVTGLISVFNASLFLATLTGIAVYMLSFTNSTAFNWGLIGVFPFHALYPLMKRVTYWPQAWLGFAMNWGMLVAYLNNSGGQMDSQILVLLAGTIAWTIFYDTIYAYQDIQDDIKVGNKSTAILFGEDNAKSILSGFALVFLVSLYYAGAANGQGTPFFLISFGGAVLHILWQLGTWVVYDGVDCGSKFRANGDLGGLIWFGLLVDYWYKSGAVTA
ncbi:hypothetical protein AAF712_009103 [Marasmius tenuissimus]|uniref:4-hydroxybenzoate polyprenyltransferase, mitochondrial n=1 Tax=Marasmius tenuissimus TaxID=585030 RepID=A0ABR2ZRC4_9AGAR|nr:hypothetical protein PM082_004205 [Marasmius tenuissimus]